MELSIRLEYDKPKGHFFPVRQKNSSEVYFRTIVALVPEAVGTLHATDTHLARS